MIQLGGWLGLVPPKLHFSLNLCFCARVEQDACSGSEQPGGIWSLAPVELRCPASPLLPNRLMLLVNFNPITADVCVAERLTSANFHQHRPRAAGGRDLRLSSSRESEGREHRRATRRRRIHSGHCYLQAAFGLPRGPDAKKALLREGRPWRRRGRGPCAPPGCPSPPARCHRVPRVVTATDAWDPGEWAGN